MIYDSASTVARPRVKQMAKSHVAKARHARVASGYVIKHETCSRSITKINITYLHQIATLRPNYKVQYERKKKK